MAVKPTSAHPPKEIGNPDRPRPDIVPTLFQLRSQRLLTALVIALLLGLGLPLLLIFLIKSPAPDEHLLIVGFSFTKLVLMMWISAAVVAYATVFPIKPKPYLILAIFLLALFGCFPLVVGLKYNFTLKQTLIESPHFWRWPFFVRPGYLLLEFILPAGVLLCLGLQLKTLFGSGPRSFLFFFAALFLGVATYMGIATLNRTAQPTLVSIINDWRQRGQPAGPGHAPESVPAASSTARADRSQVLRFPVPVTNSPAMAPAEMVTAAPAAVPEVLLTPTTGPVDPPSQQLPWRQLEEKLDRILSRLDHQTVATIAGDDPAAELTVPPEPPETSNGRSKNIDAGDALNLKLNELNATAERILALLDHNRVSTAVVNDDASNDNASKDNQRVQHKEETTTTGTPEPPAIPAGVELERLAAKFDHLVQLLRTEKPMASPAAAPKPQADISRTDPETAKTDP